MNNNEVSEPYHNILVRDIRVKQATHFSLDQQGFEVTIAEGVTEAAVLKAVTPDILIRADALQTALAPAMEAILKERLNAETVFTFASRVRMLSLTGARLATDLVADARTHLSISSSCFSIPRLARGSDPRI